VVRSCIATTLYSPEPISTSPSAAPVVAGGLDQVLDELERLAVEEVGQGVARLGDPAEDRGVGPAHLGDLSPGVHLKDHLGQVGQDLSVGRALVAF